jgi:hypothetical protein
MKNMFTPYGYMSLPVFHNADFDGDYSDDSDDSDDITHSDYGVEPKLLTSGEVRVMDDVDFWNHYRSIIYCSNYHNNSNRKKYLSEYLTVIILFRSKIKAIQRQS